MSSRSERLCAAILSLAMATGCHPSPDSTDAPVLTGQATGAATAALPNVARLAALPSGPIAGDQTDSLRATTRNPYGGNVAAIEEGKSLYISMNCADCHGFAGEGIMGPSLADDQWLFGQDDADVFSSLYSGRPKGMPAWRGVLTDEKIWKVIAYIRTLQTDRTPVTGARMPQHPINIAAP